MGDDDYIVPIDSYNYTIVMAPVLLIFIILAIATGVIFGFNPFDVLVILTLVSILIYMVIKNIVLTEIRLRKLRKQRSEDSFTSDYDSDLDASALGLMILTGVWLISAIVIKMIYSFSQFILTLAMYHYIAFTSISFVYFVVIYLRHLIKKNTDRRGDPK